MNKAFTLIELLIVVAIIAILAAIAVPNFLEAQTRAKVSRAKADMRTLATGMEAYRVDYNWYPKATDWQYSIADPDIATQIGAATARVLEKLSTPVAYLTTGGFPDPFKPRQAIRPDNQTGAITQTEQIPATHRDVARFYRYTSFTPGEGSFVSALVERPETTSKWAWATWSAGPEGSVVRLRGSNLLSSGGSFGATPKPEACLAWAYDATNGTVSKGNIWRTGGQRTGEGMAGDIWLTTMLPVTSR